MKQTVLKNYHDRAKGCAYQIPCKWCDNFYIGQTRKSPGKKVRYRKCVRYAQVNGAVFVQAGNNDHSVN